MNKRELAQEINNLLRAKAFTLSTAESCTGGGIAAAITSIPGSSEVFKGGVVAYANEAKERVLSVSGTTLKEKGAVSEETVREMAANVAKLMNTECAVATSGIAGPGGGSSEKPVGTVWTAFFIDGKVSSQLLNIPDNGRGANIENTIEKTLEKLRCLLSDY